MMVWTVQLLCYDQLSSLGMERFYTSTNFPIYDLGIAALIVSLNDRLRLSVPLLTRLASSALNKVSIPRILEGPCPYLNHFLTSKKHKVVSIFIDSFRSTNRGQLSLDPALQQASSSPVFGFTIITTEKKKEIDFSLNSQRRTSDPYLSNS